MRLISVLTLALFVWLGAVMPAHAGVQRLTRSAALDSSSILNRAGQVAWAASHYPSPEVDIYFWDGTTIRQLADHGPSFFNLQLNNAGQVAWQFGHDIYFWDGTSTRQFSIRDGAVSYLQLNNRGQLVWTSFAADGNTYFYFWDGSRLRRLNAGTFPVLVPVLNDRGRMIWFDLMEGKTADVNEWDGDAVQLLFHTDTEYRGGAVGDAGQVAWTGRTPGSDANIFYLWDGSSIRPLSDPLESFEIWNPQINRQGQVMWVGDGVSGRQIFLWDGSTSRVISQVGLQVEGLQLDDTGQITWTERGLTWTGRNGFVRHLFRWNGSRVEKIAAFPEQESYLGSVARSDTGQLVWSYNGELYLYSPSTPGSVDLNPAPVVGGDSPLGTVTLTAPALEGGTVVTLASTNPAVAAVPTSVTVPAGATQATFPVTTQPVSATADVLLTASAGGETWTTPLRVWSVTLAAVELRSDSLTGGESLVGKVRLDGVAPELGTVVTLASDHPALASLPPSATVAPGQDEAGLAIATNSVATDTPVVISATYGGVTRTTTLLLKPLALESVFVYPERVTGSTMNPGRADGHVRLEAQAREKDVIVTLTSSPPGVIEIPRTVTIPRGIMAASFPIAVHPVLRPTAVTISASYAGRTRTTTLQVDGAALGYLEMKPPSVTGGLPVQGFLSFRNEAPAGASVTLTTNRPDLVQVPSQLLTVAGQTVLLFPITTRPVPTAMSVKVTAAFNGESREVWLTLLPVMMASAGTASLDSSWSKSIATCTRFGAARRAWKPGPRTMKR